MDLINAAIARQVLDVLVRFMISPMLWKNISQNMKNGLSNGRCQSPALRLVYDNQKEIDESQGTHCLQYHWIFYNKNIPFSLNHQFTMDSDPNMENFLEEQLITNICLKRVNETTKNPPLPFTTSALQQSANTNLRISPKSTMKICQKLYEVD